MLTKVTYLSAGHFNKQALRPVYYVSILILSTFLISCSNQQQVAHNTSIIVFGTTVNITIYHNKDNSKTALESIRKVEYLFQDFHQKWHAWEQGGIVSKINDAISNNNPIKINDSIKNFIIKSQILTQQSQGLFDPGIGQLIDLWGFHADNWQGPPPEKQQIQNWLGSRPSLLDIYFKGLTLYSSNPNVQLDFGGNAKGLAIDLALESLRNSGIENAIVSIGGDMKAIGSKNGQPWHVGIQNPQQPDRAIASLFLKNGESVVTSGTYQRYFEWQGQRYSHIINPNTGYPANSFASVTVIHPDATSADAAATALLIAGPEQWQNIAQSMGIQLAFLVDNQGKIFKTKAMNERIQELQDTSK